MLYEITNWAGETTFESDNLTQAENWLRLFGIRGDALWDNESDSDNPLEEVL